MMRGGSIPCAAGCQCGRHAKPKGQDSPHWVGDQITHKAMHERVKRVRGAARDHDCLFHAEHGESKPALDWAQLNETSGLHIADYIPLCRTCHIRLDDDAGLRPSAARSAGVRTSWADPATAERRRAALRASWARRKSTVTGGGGDA